MIFSLAPEYIAKFIAHDNGRLAKHILFDRYNIAAYAVLEITSILSRHSVKRYYYLTGQMSIEEDLLRWVYYRLLLQPAYE